MPGFRTERAAQLLEAVDPQPGRQTRLAAHLGVSRAAVNAWLRGVKQPSGQLLVDLAAYLGTTADDLLPPTPQRQAAGQ
ncbi:MAG: helix-turn-helix transcriptional regulator [Chloroflexota bacterium]|nr:helix-turn-helix transcriptional regulator [Chloroflexota bacterium]